LRERVVGGVRGAERWRKRNASSSDNGLVGADHLLAHEREEMCGQLVAFQRRREPLQGTAVEYVPFDRTSADRVALAGAEAVESRLEERLDRRGHGDLALCPRLSSIVATISSRNSGLPPAAARIRALGLLRSTADREIEAASQSRAGVASR
jgi:hypothetical protein